MKTLIKRKYIFIIIFLLSVFLITPLQTRASTCSWQEGIKKSATGVGGSGATYNSTEYICSNSQEVVAEYSQCKSEDRPGQGIKYICCCAGNQTVYTQPPKFQVPEIQIDLGIKFEAPNCTTDDTGKYQCEVNWLGQYLTAIYNYALKFGGIIAAIMLMAGGLLWLVSGGDPGKIGQAKNIISGSLIGLVILFTSVIILTEINPNLITFKPIKLGTVGEKNFPDAEYTSGDVAMPESYQQACVESKKKNLAPCQALGNSQPAGLISYNGVIVNPETATKFTTVLQCVADKNQGQNLFKINEGFRSAAEQIRLKEKYTSEGMPDRAADPCCSNHSSGIAIDVKR